MPTEPTPEEIREFAETLDLYAVAKELLWLKGGLDHAGDAPWGAGRNAALCSTMHLIEFLKAIPQLGYQIPPPALTQLHLALADLDYGKVSLLLKPTVSRRRGQPVSIERCGLRAAAAAAMDCLMQSGFKRPEAAAITGKELRRLGIEFGDSRHANVGTSISNWRSRAMRGTSEETEIYNVLRGLFRRSGYPAADKKRVLQALKDSLRNLGIIP
jgi:hypothetical protein